MQRYQRESSMAMRMTIHSEKPEEKKRNKLRVVDPKAWNEMQQELGAYFISEATFSIMIRLRDKL